MTETVAIVAADPTPTGPRPHRRAGSGHVVRLVDPTSRVEVDAGTPGMVMVCGERGVDLFAGYLDDAATTDGSFITDEHGATWFITAILPSKPPVERCDSPDAPTM